jgi:uncharacterized membrane protein YeaQ/YmgE (transglycosylase-associated protein family)
LQALVSTPSVVAVIDAVIAGFICGLLAQAVNASAAVSRVAGVLGALVLLGMLTVVPARQITRFVRTHQPRFPRER